MTERYGYGYGDEPAGNDLPGSRRGGVTERHQERDNDDDVREIDLTDDADDRDRRGEAEPASGYGAAGDDVPSDLPADRADEGEEPGQGGAATASQVDRHEEEMAWSSDLDHPGADRGDEVELAMPTPAPEPGVEPAADPLASATGTEDAPTTGLASSVPATPATVSTTLLASVDAESVRRQFLDIQAGFVDEPRQAVQQAGALVDDLVRQVTQSLTAERERLLGSLDDDTTSTEDLRLVLRAYRAYVDRLLGLAM